MEAHEENVASLAQRLAKVETQNRRLKTAVGIIMLVIVAVGITGAAPNDKTVTARKFVVVDEQGRQRVLIGSTEGGGSGIALVDPEGTGRAVFLLSADNQPGVIMNGTDGEPRVVMRVNDENRASLQLAGANAKGGIGFSISRTRIMLGLTDNDGRLRFLTYLDRNGLPGIRLSDADGKTLWQAP